MVPDPTSSLSSSQRVPEPNRFNELVMATMNDLASCVSNVGSGAKKFGITEVKFTASQTLYTLVLVQCTLNRPGCCGGKESGVVLFSSCVIAFTVNPSYLLFNTSPPTRNPTVLVPPPSNPGRVTIVNILVNRFKILSPLINQYLPLVYKKNIVISTPLVFLLSI
jgi:hypothetical protein